MSTISIAILICALNEEKNIGALLNDILTQHFSIHFGGRYAIRRILVTSDGSSDQTADIVRSFAHKDTRVELVENPQRIGKIFSLNNAFNRVDEDYVILFDADVRLKEDTIETLVRPLDNHLYELIGGNPVPYGPPSIFNMAEQASYFSWLLLQDIKRHNPNSIYSAHGRILLASIHLYKTAEISKLSTPGDDQYLYLRSDHNFYYQRDAVVRYKMPSTISDYLKQNVRFRTAKQVRGNSLSEHRIREEFKITNKLTILLSTMLLHPISFSCWAYLYTLGFLKWQFRTSKNNTWDESQVWGEVTSTK
jgi:glycosyltransferase involved in cell wall biosynthesis